MIFSTPVFIFIFLPITIISYYIIINSKFNKYSGLFICLSSLVFYSWSKPEYIFVILFSTVINYYIGIGIINTNNKKFLYICGLVFNIIYLGYFKYINFAINNLNNIFDISLPVYEIILPIGISFFTFQQIAWITDIFTSKFEKFSTNFIDYCCFILFFPQLLAGPIVHHHEMMPQFSSVSSKKINWNNIFNGIILFSIGLAKKVMIADNLAPIVAEFFDKSHSLSFMEALLGSLSFTFELYFDFSGYCDMALACALFFNIKLPINFNSPYKATNIQDFWRRWHITLSRWLKEYIYIPLGGNRIGTAKTLRNLLMTFLLGGLWHGAAWTFIGWGGAHGLALVTHRLWQKTGIQLNRILSCIITFIFINMAWILFRSRDLDGIKKFYHAFTGQNGFAIRQEYFSTKFLDSVPGNSSLIFFVSLGICFALVFFAPNSNKILHWPEKIKLLLAIMLSICCFISVVLPDSHPQFIYSQF